MKGSHASHSARIQIESSKRLHMTVRPSVPLTVIAIDQHNNLTAAPLEKLPRSKIGCQKQSIANYSLIFCFVLCCHRFY